MQACSWIDLSPYHSLQERFGWLSHYAVSPAHDTTCRCCGSSTTTGPAGDDSSASMVRASAPCLANTRGFASAIIATTAGSRPADTSTGRRYRRPRSTRRSSLHYLKHSRAWLRPEGSVFCPCDKLRNACLTRQFTLSRPCSASCPVPDAPSPASAAPHSSAAQPGHPAGPGRQAPG